MAKQSEQKASDDKQEQTVKKKEEKGVGLRGRRR